MQNKNDNEKKSPQLRKELKNWPLQKKNVKTV